jgi:hypothetical protein
MIMHRGGRESASEHDMAQDDVQASARRIARGLVARQPALFRRLMIFNYQPASYLHPAWRARFAPPGLAPQVWEQPRSQRPLSKLILASLELEQRPCFDAAQRAWPLALLEGARLERLACHVGAVLLAPQARLSVSREAVLAWKERLTPQAYQFVMSSASLLPSVKEAADIDAGVSAQALGLEWIASSLAGAPEPLLARVRLKFPPDQSLTAIPRQRATQVVSAVFSTLEPRWVSSFAMARR